MMGFVGAGYRLIRWNRVGFLTLVGVGGFLAGCSRGDDGQVATQAFRPQAPAVAQPVQQAPAPLVSAKAEPASKEPNPDDESTATWRGDQQGSDSSVLDSDVLDRCKKATALICSIGSDKAQLGTGFAIDHGADVVTARHVVVNDGEVQAVYLVFDSGSDDPKMMRVSANDIVTDPEWGPGAASNEHDLAIIHLPHPVDASLSVARSLAVRETSTVWAFGFPDGIEIRTAAEQLPSPTVHTLRVERIEEHGGEVQLLQLAGSPTHGDSGGPVVDGQGNVIGVMQSIEDESSTIV